MSIGSFARSAFVTTIVLSLVVSFGVLGLRAPGTLQPLELTAYDWLVRVRPTAPAPPRVTLVTVTENDIQSLGRWPIANQILAAALELILEHKPRVVGVDIYMDVPVPPGREQLDAVLSANPNIIAAIKFPRGAERGVPPPAVLEDTDQMGFTDMIVDPGGIVRRGLLFLNNDEMFVSSLSLRTALAYLSAQGVSPVPDPDVPEHMRLGETTIQPLETSDGSYVNADAGGYQFMLDYRDSPRSIPEIPLMTVLSRQADPELIRDRVILLGVAADSVKDVFYIPFSQGQDAERVIPGVALHGLAVSQLLRFALDGDRPVKVLTDLQEALWIVLWGLAGGIFGFLVRSPLRFTLGASAGLALLCALGYGVFTLGWWIPLIPPVLSSAIAATIVTAYISYSEMQERAKLMHLFSRHISKQLAVDIWDHRDQFLSGGHPMPQKLVGTVFFSDVVRFTTVSERLEPSELMDWLNEYMSVMTPLINDHNGVILRFIGDAIMAVFGVPVPRTSDEEIAQDAESAVTCALAMRQALIEHNRSLEEKGMPQIGMRIGILTGEMIAGSIGDMDRLEYNVHGDVVNTAARLESFNKDDFEPDYLNDPCRILIGKATLERVHDRFDTIKIGEVKLKGKEKTTAVHQVLGLRESRERRPESVGSAIARASETHAPGIGTG